jgi:hypothetical protein
LHLRAATGVEHQHSRRHITVALKVLVRHIRVVCVWRWSSMIFSKLQPNPDVRRGVREKFSSWVQRLHRTSSSMTQNHKSHGTSIQQMLCYV